MIYCVDVELFDDSNGDGVGDFPGLTDRVDYLAGLGITCIWLMPFYPSPNRDNGYDIADYYGVDPRLGTLGDVVEFLRAARERGIRVIADLVVNHTSVDHPWFQAARADRDSPYRDFYCWADEPPADGPKDIVFPGQETSNWEFDERAGQYYLHRFYKSMPDLNIANPNVRDEIHKVVGFWLELGMSGFRLDAAPFLIELTSTEQAGRGDPHEYLRDLRAFLDRRRGDAILLAEANLPPRNQRRFFGDEDGDEMHMLFNFIANQRLFLSVVREQAAPLAEALHELPPGHPPPRAADAERGPAPAPARLQPAARPAGNARPAVRGGDRDGRRPGRGGARQRAHRHALELDGPDRDAALAELFADERYQHVETLADGVAVGGYGYRWFRLC